MKTDIVIDQIISKFENNDFEKIRDYVLRFTVSNLNYIVKIKSGQNIINRQAFNVLTKGLVDDENLINKPLASFPYKDNFLWIEKEIPGTMDYEKNKLIMPEIFSRIARFHLQNRRTGKVTYMYHDGKSFENIEAMLKYEFGVLEKNWDDKSTLDLCYKNIMLLKNGFQTIIHSDIHLGNVLIENGQPRLIDAEWACSSLNLFDFEHVDLFNFSREYPEKISAEALTCYKNYFTELGISSREAKEQIISLGILKLMRQNAYDKYKKNYDHLAMIPAILEKIPAFRYES